MRHRNWFRKLLASVARALFDPAQAAVDLQYAKFSVRPENTVVIGENQNIDLMASIPIEAEEIEELMNRKK